MRIQNLHFRRFFWWVRRTWYEKRYGYTFGMRGTMLPSLGKGKFVDVLRKGNYLEIISHKNPKLVRKAGTIRLIPYQPNHGVMVEYIDEIGQMKWRTHMEFTDFYNHGSNGQEKSA